MCDWEKLGWYAESTDGAAHFLIHTLTHGTYKNVERVYICGAEYRGGSPSDHEIKSICKECSSALRAGQMREAQIEIDLDKAMLESLSGRVMGAVKRLLDSDSVGATMKYEDAAEGKHVHDGTHNHIPLMDRIKAIRHACEVRLKKGDAPADVWTHATRIVEEWTDVPANERANIAGMLAVELQGLK